MSSPVIDAISTDPADQLIICDILRLPQPWHEAFMMKEENISLFLRNILLVFFDRFLLLWTSKQTNILQIFIPQAFTCATFLDGNTIGIRTLQDFFFWELIHF